MTALLPARFHKIGPASLLLLASLTLAACQNPDQYGSDGYGDGSGVNGGAITGGALGDPSDPQSPAYFNQTVGDRVWFEVDQSVLSDQARMTLNAQAQWLNAHPQYNVLIEGHADEQGTREYNIALSARRAAAVQQYLIAQGVAPQRIQTVPYGKERPVAICSDESCYAQNRRAVTVLQTGSGV